MNTHRRSVFFFVLLIVVLAAILSVLVIQAQEAESTPDDREEMLRDSALRVVDDVFISGDFSLLDNYLAEDYVVHSPFGDLDREATKAFLGGLRSALTDFEMVRDPVVVEGDLVATYNVLSGVFSNEYPSPWGVLEPNNEPVTWIFIAIFRYNDEGLIVEEWVQADTLGLLTQLGAAPTS